MACDFLLDVKGVQRYRDQEPETVELTTERTWPFWCLPLTRPWWRPNAPPRALRRRTGC